MRILRQTPDMLRLLILYLAFSLQAIARTETSWTTIQHFLALTSMPSQMELRVGGEGFANEHITVLAASVFTPRVKTYTGSGDPETTTSMYPGNRIVFAFNDTFYSHRLWIGLAFSDARCTAQATSAETWECNSWIMNASIPYAYTTPFTVSLPYKTTTVTIYPSSTVLAAENLYTISFTSLFTAPPLSSWTPSSQIPAKESTAASEGAKASSGTIAHVPVQTNNALAVKFSHKGIKSLAVFMVYTIALIPSM